MLFFCSFMEEIMHRSLGSTFFLFDFMSSLWYVFIDFSENSLNEKLRYNLL